MKRREFITGAAALASYGAIERANALTPQRRVLLGGGASGAGLPPIPKWQAAQAARTAGTRNAILLVVGDSTSAGWGGQGTSAQTNSLAFSWPTVLATLQPNGQSSTAFADHNSLTGGGGTITLPIFDNRISLGSWVQNLYPGGSSTTNTIAGDMLRCTAGVSPLAFTPTNQVDTFVAYYVQNTGFGAMTAQIDSGGTTAINTAGTAAVIKQTFTTTLGSHTFNLARTSGQVFLVGVIAFNSAQKETTVINGGFSGSKAADWNTVNGVWDPLLVIPQLVPDLTIICLTVNDWVAATSTSAYTISIQNIINVAKTTGDVVLMSGPASQTTSAPQATQDIYTNITKSLAASNNLRFLNMTAALGNWATNNALSREFDSLHPNGTYYSLQAALVNSLIAVTVPPATGNDLLSQTGTPILAQTGSPILVQ